MSNVHRPVGLVLIVVGTRPEIIKVAPVIRACQSFGLPNEIAHTGQHYSYELDRLIFQDLGIEAPLYNLGIGSGSHAEETARALVGLESLFRKLNPSIVLVQGDTNSTLAGALAASKIQIPVGHIEAGLRSFDNEMPEEKNRIITDHISELLFAPTEISKRNLLNEGIAGTKIRVTGNTIVDSVRLGLDLLKSRSKHVESHPSLPDEGFLLLTLHREENVDREDRLRKIIKGIALASSELGIKTVFPAHPRTAKRIKEYGINLPECLIMTAPVGYLDFLSLERNSDLILTDSGGVQEEACILETPCVTLRENTERPETIEVGANRLTGLDPETVLLGVKEMIERSGGWDNPFGDGKSGLKIVDAIKNSWERDA